MAVFWRVLLSFKDIPDDKPATFKQKQAVALKIANADYNLLPELNRFVVAKRIQGAMYGLEQKTGIQITHREIQDLFENPQLPEKVKKQMDDFFKVNNRFSDSLGDKEKKDPKDVTKGTKLEDLF